MQVVHYDVDVSVTASISMLMFSRFLIEYKGLDHTTTATMLPLLRG